MPDGPRVALVGFGKWGRHILRDLVALGCAVTVVDRSGSPAALDEGAAGVVGSVEEPTDVDGVVVATPIRTHAQVIEQVLDRFNVPVFVEKPLTDDRQAAHRLARRAPDRLFVMDKWRYHPGIEALRDVASSGDLGPIHEVRTARLQWGTTHSDVDGIWVLAPHDLAIGMEILGHLPPPRWAVADRAGDRPTGMLAVLGNAPSLVMEVSVAAPVWRREIRLHCRDGVAFLADSYADHLEVKRPGGEERRLPISTELPLLRELRAFVEHLRGGPPPRSSEADGAAVVDLIAELRALAGLDGHV